MAASGAARPSGHAASTGDLVKLVLVAAVILGGRWYWHARRHPYGVCWKCEGTGMNAGSTRKRKGRCKRCGGRGERLRVGAGLLNKGLIEAKRRKK